MNKLRQITAEHVQCAAEEVQCSAPSSPCRCCCRECPTVPPRNCMRHHYAAQAQRWRDRQRLRTSPAPRSTALPLLDDEPF